MMKMPSGTSPTSDKASRKQLQIIKNLQNTENQIDITMEFLTEIKKTNIEELSRKEASSLIDKLKD